MWIRWSDYSILKPDNQYWKDTSITQVISLKSEFDQIQTKHKNPWNKKHWWIVEGNNMQLLQLWPTTLIACNQGTNIDIYNTCVKTCIYWFYSTSKPWQLVAEIHTWVGCRIPIKLVNCNFDILLPFDFLFHFMRITSYTSAKHHLPTLS